MSTQYAHSHSGRPSVALFKKIGIFMALMVCMAVTTYAQSTNDWDDEEEDETEEKTLVDDRPAKKDDVTIQLNEELYTWKDELSVHRGDTLDISVRDLAAGSRVEIVAEKGGISVGRKVFYANHKGELDLEIRTGTKKMKGNITLSYTPSGGAKKDKSVHLIVD